MILSSVGASQSLDLISLMTTKRSGSSGGSTDTDATSDSLTLSLSAQVLSQAQGSNPFQTDFDNLGSLIDSGDLAGAKKAYAAMQAKMQAHSASDGSTDPLADAFTAIGKALDSGDATAAKSAFAAMQTQLSTMGGAGASQSGTDPFQQDMAKLGKLIDSGDLAGAKSLLQTIESRRQAHQPPTSSASQSASGTDASTSFSALSSALQAGDLSSAQAAWTALMKDLQNHSTSSGG